MKKLSKPNDSALDVFTACIDRIRDDNLKMRLIACSQEIQDSAVEFDLKASNAQLHTIFPKDNVATMVTVNEMKSVYTNRMAKKLAPGRIYYDRLMSLPDHGRCPLCSQRVVSTLDHHLPKAHFPSLAVSPFNLIPACQDCNKTKNEGIPTCSEEETLHPYYDDVEQFVWVKAKIRESIPVAIEFYVDPPNTCPPVLTERMKYHFKAFRLGALYASHAAEELASIEYIAKIVHDKSGSDELKNYLSETAAGKKSVSLNSWQSALYSCLSENNWFCEIRFTL
ncbi:HNH endonuclease [Tatumella saanichensis]|uniref:HNH endonuclease n=1 Tax=Tatumella saanichensis TaxID=480813 RepID=UPI0004A4434E|nr:HNH endonuclease [Tatumella saanichensis]